MNEPLIADETNVASLPWALFFNQSYVGDTGTTWTPTFNGLGSTGTPTISGVYYKLSQNLVFFRIRIVPSTDTTSTAGTTYCDNFPLTIFNDGACLSVGNNLGGSSGMAVAANNRIYTPAWSAVNYPVSVVGLVEAR